MVDGINTNFNSKRNKNIHNYSNLKQAIFYIKIILLLYYLSITQGKYKNYINFSSEIHLLIKGNGTQKLLNESFYLKPTEIIVNGINIDSNITSYEFEYEENNVTLIYNDTLNSTQSMFFGMDNLIEADLSLFDFSLVTTMENMFRHCYNITKINFGNINTSSVVHMGRLFSCCKKLESLDVSNFDTSKVTTLESMFYNCSSLTSINVSNFNTSNVEKLRVFFYNCQNLGSIDITNFDTSKVTIIDGMFYGCSSLTSIDLTNFNTTNVKSMRSLFYNCKNLLELNLSNFDTSKVTDMRYLFDGLIKLTSIDISNFNIQNIDSFYALFYNCQSLTSIDISFFDTSKIKDFSYLFYGCINIKSLNLNNMDTSSSKNMAYLFYNCQKLTSLDLTNFDTSLVTDMSWMFYNCYSIQSLKFPSLYNTSKVVSMCSMFQNCKSLISLNLSSFDVSKVSNMNNMFYDCNNLRYLDIPHFSPNNLEEMIGIFYNMSSLIYLNINSLDINQNTKINSSFDKLASDLKICSNKTNMQNYLLSINKTYDCSDICFIQNIKIDLNRNECIHSCNENGYNHECNNICYNGCPENTHYLIKNISNKDKIFDEYENGVAICIEYNTEGYFLDEYEFYEECYNSCKFCFGKGNEKNNNCIKCKYKYFFINDEDDIKFETNCYERCQYYYYLNESKEYFCTENKNCSGNFNNLISEKSKCIDYCENDKIYKYEYDNICYEECPKDTIVSSKNQYICLGEKDIYQNDIVNNEDIHEIIVSNVLNNYNISNGEEIVYQGEDNFIFHITSTENELERLKGKNNDTNKFSVINLGKCGSLLKKHYNINENISLILMKYERVGNISSERSLQYEVYEPYNKTKLNLSVCDNENINIDIYIPVTLSEKTQNLFDELKEMGYDLFDINSPFYNDICTPYKSTDGTDVLLSDRVNSYFYNDDTSCQSNCKFSDYLMESNYLKCECDIKNSEIDTNNAKSFNAKSIYQSFYNVLKFSNYKVLKCSKLALNINNFTLENKGSILALVYFFIHFLFIITYFIKGIGQLKNEFSKIKISNFQKNHVEKVKNNKKKERKNTNRKLISKADKKIVSHNLKIYKKMKHEQNNNINNNLKMKNLKDNKKDIPNKIKINPPKKSIFLHKISKFDIKNKKNIIESENSKTNKNSSLNSLSKNIFMNNHINNINKINKENIDIKKYYQLKEEKLDYYELNNLEYDLAKTLDTRNFFQIYLSFLKREHSIIFTFITRDDHNITFVKYSRFFFLLCSDMAMNVFFFSDETMHKMFLDYGKYNFIQQVPQILYSTIVSKLIETFLCFLSLTDKYYYQAKNIKNDSKRLILEILKCIKIKIAFFFLFSSLMFIFYWYIITCFCAVYHNTQIAFIKDSLSSFALGILLPFVVYLFPSILRIIALKANKYNLVYIYKMRNIIPFF